MVRLNISQELKILVLSFIIALAFLSIVSSIQNDANNKLDFTYPQSTNYSTIDVNNSQYWQGYTPQSYNTTFIVPMCSGFVPYTNAIQDVNLGSYNLNTTGVIHLQEPFFPDPSTTILRDGGIDRFGAGFSIWTSGDFEVSSDNGAYTFGTGILSADQIQANNICYSNGTNCQSVNPFDQTLNTTSNVTFSSVNITSIGNVACSLSGGIICRNATGMYLTGG